MTDDEYEALFGRLYDAFSSAEEAAARILYEQPDDILDRIAADAGGGGTFGGFVGHAARSTKLFRHAVAYFAATGAEMATFEEVEAFERTRGSS